MLGVENWQLNKCLCLASAWLQFSKSTGDVRAVLVTPDGKFNTAGMIVVQSGCWTMLKGGATSFSAGKGELFFEVRNVASYSRMTHQTALMTLVCNNILINLRANHRLT